MELESIPGVGPKTATALRELDDPVETLTQEDVAAVAAIDGISSGRAARIVKNATRHRHDDVTAVLGTERAKEIYEQLLELLADRTVTEYGSQRLQTFYPSATPSRIKEVRTLVEQALDRTPDATVQDRLAAVEPVESPGSIRVRERCLVTTDAETYATATDKIPELPVEVIDDRRELAELARGYTTVIVLDEKFAGIDIDGDVRVEPDALDRPVELVPERTLSFFANNRETIDAAIDIHRHAALSSPCDLDELETALERLDSDGTPKGDVELDRLTTAVEELDAAVSMATSVANDRLESSIRERDVTVEGSDLLSLVERGAGVDSILARELTEEYSEAIGAARDQLIDALQLHAHEETLAKRVFSEEPTFPVEQDEEAVSTLREELTTARDRRAARQKQELATTLTDYRQPVETLVERSLELDVELAIAQFADDYSCTLPTLEWKQDQRYIELSGGKSPLLEEPHDAIEPIDYRVAGVVLLSGVNSGGKTSLLDLLAACVILAQMGMPVPAETARLTPFRRLYYHAKTQGTLDAGAFESTVQEFADLATGDPGSLVLVDELESITEPGASAKIIAGILESLSDQEVTAVFVSHLAQEINAAADVEIPVDGIEAKGLEDGELIVDRSPKKDHLARSTPELIVEKLAEQHGQTFYRDLLEKFEPETPEDNKKK